MHRWWQSAKGTHRRPISYRIFLLVFFLFFSLWGAFIFSPVILPFVYIFSVYITQNLKSACGEPKQIQCTTPTHTPTLAFAAQTIFPVYFTGFRFFFKTISDIFSHLIQSAHGHIRNSNWLTRKQRIPIVSVWVNLTKLINCLRLINAQYITFQMRLSSILLMVTNRPNYVHDFCSNNNQYFRCPCQ